MTLSDFIVYAFLACVLAYYVIVPFFGGVIRGVYMTCRKCNHADAAEFHAHNNEVTIQHCFKCGCSSVNGDAYTDRGIRSGDDMQAFISEIEEELEPELDDLPEPLPLPSRVHHLLKIVGRETASQTNAVVLGRNELNELFPILVGVLEREEQFRRASALRQSGMNSHVFQRELTAFRISGLAVIPNYETDSCIALTTV